MILDREKKKSYSIYFIYAILLAIFSFFFLNILFKLGLVLLKIIIRYWWACLVIFLIFLFFKKRGKKK